MPHVRAQARPVRHARHEPRRSSRAFPSCLPPLPAGAPRNRLGLARWLASPENPLTARVTVNRIWQHHFGKGLVKTAENFGIQGEPPSHPELLDWLATELVRTGWDVKAMHRLIVTSATYRQASQCDAGPGGTRPGEPAAGARTAVSAPGRSGARQRPGDRAACWSSGSAARRSSRTSRPASGKSWPAARARDLRAGQGPGLYRRSLYVYRKRTVPHPVLATFDAPSREICQVKRPRTNTPLQALELLNDVTYVEAARQLAQLALDEGGSSARGADHLRLPPGDWPACRRRASWTSCGAGWSGTARTFEADKEAALQLIRHGESPPDPKLDPVELAAYTATASVILNLDETITLE